MSNVNQTFVVGQAVEVKGFNDHSELSTVTKITATGSIRIETGQLFTLQYEKY